MKRGLIIGLVAALAVLLVGWYAASPYLAMNDLREAARTGDRDRLEQLVDFPRVREGLKADFTAGLMAKAQNDPDMKDNPFASLAAMFVPVLVDKIVDAAVSPQGIARMQQGEGVGVPGKKKSGPGPAANPVSNPAAARPKNEPKLTYHYAGLNRFRVDQPTEKGPMTWVLARTGLFSWQLIRIELPPKIFEQGGAAAPAAG